MLPGAARQKGSKTRLQTEYDVGRLDKSSHPGEPTDEYANVNRQILGLVEEEREFHY